MSFLNLKMLMFCRLTLMEIKTLNYVDFYDYND